MSASYGLTENISTDPASNKQLNHGDSIKVYARFAGLFYLLIAISGGFSIGYVPSVIVAPGDASATAQNIADNLGLFRLGIAADILVFMFEVALTVLLYRLFKPVNPTLSLVAAFCRLAMSVVMGLNLLNYLIPLILLSGTDYLSVFDTDQLHALALLFLETHQYGVYIWGLFFGLHLLALGYLILKSGYFPKAMGILMMIGSVGYTSESLAAIASVDNSITRLVVIAFLVVAVVGELSFTFWLLIKGVNVNEWIERSFFTQTR
ncbi:MAG: hypothetical protein ACJAZF_004393 [Granulosicoccus sp.]|jgi:hypothetical protein